jgi:hypothetical protein
MLDGQAYKAHFPEDPDPERSIGVETPRPRNLLAALAALEDEFRTILKQNAPSTD